MHFIPNGQEKHPLTVSEFGYWNIKGCLDMNSVLIFKWPDL